MELVDKFEPNTVWYKLLNGNSNVFMAVPTIYSKYSLTKAKLLNAYEQLSQKDKIDVSKLRDKFRLMVSGSSALPASVFNKWRDITGITLLERYGMTEIGMALSNSYKEVSERTEVPHQV